MQLGDACMKLYHFWESVRDAPDEVAVIMDNLLYLSTVLKDIAHDKQLAPSVVVGLECCQSKVRVRSYLSASQERILIGPEGTQ